MERTYFKDVAEISLDDWNYIYMPAFDREVWIECKDLDCCDMGSENTIFNAMVEDTDGLVYKLAALLPDTGPTVIKVTPWEGNEVDGI